jgi:hypothetical protein
MKFFGSFALLAIVIAMALGMFVSIHWLRTGETAPYTSMITLSVGGLLFGFLLGAVALLADLIGRVRFELEEMLYESRRSRLDTPAIRKVS